MRQDMIDSDQNRSGMKANEDAYGKTEWHDWKQRRKPKEKEGHKEWRITKVRAESTRNEHVFKKRRKRQLYVLMDENYHRSVKTDRGQRECTDMSLMRREKEKREKGTRKNRGREKGKRKEEKRKRKRGERESGEGSPKQRVAREREKGEERGERKEEEGARESRGLQGVQFKTVRNGRKQRSREARVVDGGELRKVKPSESRHVEKRRELRLHGW